ncbi:MAG: hypothetical protein DYG89_43490 [Caldilinea sp. CFX5]|nr:hypothetical protein [Caldilinea sp. CFX5]
MVCFLLVATAVMMIKQVDHNADVTDSQTARDAQQFHLATIAVGFFLDTLSVFVVYCWQQQ